MKTQTIATLSFVLVLTCGTHLSHADPLSYDDNVLIYNGTTRAKFLCAQVQTNTFDSKSSGDLPWAAAFKRNFSLRSLSAIDCWGHSVYIPYGTYRDPETGRTQRIYWFAGGPFACEAYPFPKNLVSFPDDSRGRNWRQRAYQSYGNNLGHYDHDDSEVEVPEGGSWGGPRINFGFDLDGRLGWFRHREVFPPRGSLARLGLVFENTDNPGTREYESFLARSLRGTGFAYLFNDSGQTCQSWSAPGCNLNLNMTLAAQEADGGPYVEGYDFACLNTSLSYRLNSSLTAASNVFNPIIQASNSGPKTTYPGTLAYGTEVAQGSLEDGGYRFASEQDLYFFIYLTILGLDPDDLK